MSMSLIKPIISNKINSASLTKSTNIYNNYSRCMTPIVINRSTVKTSTANGMTQSNFCKKSVKNLIPKYMAKPRHAFQKENLLFEIQNQNKKLKKQFCAHLNMEIKLQKKKVHIQRKTHSLKKLNHFNGPDIEGIQRNITSLMQKPLLFETKQQNFIKSIYCQIQNLTIQSQKNEQAILKLKQLKKYTRFLQNEQEKKTFLQQLRQIKKYMRRLKTQILRLKRTHKQEKIRKMQQIMMEGQIEDEIQSENVRIYREIEDKNHQLKSINMKKTTLNKKKQTLHSQIQQLRKRHKIPKQIIQQICYQRDCGSKVLSNTYTSPGKSHQSQTFESWRKTKLANPNRLSSLRQEEEYQQSMEQHQYQQKIPKNDLKDQKDFIKETAVQTVKVNSKVPSQNGDFMGVLYDQDEQEEYNDVNLQKQRKNIEKLEKKYFYEDQQFDDEDKSEVGKFDNGHKQDGKLYDSQDYGSQSDSSNNQFNESQIEENSQFQSKKRLVLKQGKEQQIINPKQTAIKAPAILQINRNTKIISI